MPSHSPFPHDVRVLLAENIARLIPLENRRLNMTVIHADAFGFVRVGKTEAEQAAGTVQG